MGVIKKMENSASDSADTGIFTADVKQETNGQDVSEMVNIKVQERDGSRIEVTLDRNRTLQELKEELGEQRRCLARNMRLTLSGQSLDQDGMKLDEIQLEDQVIQLIRVQDTTMVIPTETPRQNSEALNMSNAVRSRLNNCRILQRNFEACVDAAQTSKDPAHRERFNEAETPTPPSPSARDFGYLVRDMANSLRTWSFQLHRLSDQLIRDEPLPDSNSKEYQTARRLIQNNMDASRYMSPELQNFCQFVIPLGDEPPRGLAVLARSQPRRPSAVPK